MSEADKTDKLFFDMQNRICDLREELEAERANVKDLRDSNMAFQEMNLILRKQLNNQWISVNCDNCGKDFPKKQAEIKRTKSNFCCKKCTGEYRKKESISTFYENTTKMADCLEWNGCKNEDGYGVRRYEGKVMLTHRISYLLSNGDIPDGMHVLHKCDYPPCVNPEHLFLGTHQDNMRDMTEKGRRYTKPLPTPPEGENV